MDAIERREVWWWWGGGGSSRSKLGRRLMRTGAITGQRIMTGMIEIKRVERRMREEPGPHMTPACARMEEECWRKRN